MIRGVRYFSTLDHFHIFSFCMPEQSSTELREVSLLYGLIDCVPVLLVGVLRHSAFPYAESQAIREGTTDGRFVIRPVIVAICSGMDPIRRFQG